MANKKPKGVTGVPANPLAAYYNQLDLKRKLHERHNALIRAYAKLYAAAHDVVKNPHNPDLARLEAALDYPKTLADKSHGLECIINKAEEGDHDALQSPENLNPTV